MINLFKTLFTTNKAKKVNPIASSIEIKETSANNWWS
jgi:predicted transcriptional regulator